MAKGTYPEITDGGKFNVDIDNEYLRFACCSCGHVHIFVIDREEKGKCKVTLDSDRKGTAQLRRHNFGSLQKKNPTKWDIKRKR